MPKLRMWNGNAWNLVDTNAIQLGGKLINLDGLNQGETLIYDSATDSFIAGIPANRGGDVLSPLRSRQKLAQQTNKANINIPQFRHGVDALFVFQNGMYIHEESDYDVLEDNQIQLKEGQWDEGTLIEVVVYQITSSEESTLNASLLENPQLIKDLQNKITQLETEISNLKHQVCAK